MNNSILTEAERRLVVNTTNRARWGEHHGFPFAAALFECMRECGAVIVNSKAYERTRGGRSKPRNNR
jgi:hypothetical protein